MVTEVKVFFPVLVCVFNFDLFEFSAAISEKGLLHLFVLMFDKLKTGPRPMLFSDEPQLRGQLSHPHEKPLRGSTALKSRVNLTLMSLFTVCLRLCLKKFPSKI